MWQALSLRWGAPIEELQKRVTHREFVYWCKVYSKRPFDDEHVALTAQALIRMDMRSMAGGDKKVTLGDLIPYRDDDRNALERRIDEVL